MKFQLGLIATAVTLASLITTATASALVTRQDGVSGDGDCDPCDESCEIFTRRDDPTVPRLLEANDTSPWLPGEGVRWRRLVGRQQDFMLEFDCSNLPEICNNICFGLFCGGKNLQQELTIDRGSCAAARAANSCGSSNPNYCSTKVGFPAGYSCDEYPFASTLEGKAAGGNAATRCVPRGQNSSQGGSISGLYRNGQGTGMLPDGTEFLVDLGNPNAPGVDYCASFSGGTTDCTAMPGDPNSAGTQR